MLSGSEEELISTAKVEEGGGVSKRGNTVRDKYGDDYFRRIGKKGGNALKDKRGSEYYRSIAQKGGRANVVKYGPGHFSEMGKKGGNTTRERRGSDFYKQIGKMGGSVKKQKAVDGREGGRDRAKARPAGPRA